MLNADNIERNFICKLELDAGNVQEFKDAIENAYWFEFFMGIISGNLGFFRYISSLFQTIHLVFCSPWQMVLYDGDC